VAWTDLRGELTELFAEFTHRVYEVETALEKGKAKRARYWRNWWLDNPDKVRQYRKTCYANRKADPDRAARQRKHNREYAARRRAALKAQ